MRIFEIKDKSGRNIYLSNERWKHITKHPEMQDKHILEKIKDTLIKPDTIISESYEVAIHTYYRYAKERKKYLLVSVKYLNGEGYVITSFYTDVIQ